MYIPHSIKPKDISNCKLQKNRVKAKKIEIEEGIERSQILKASKAHCSPRLAARTLSLFNIADS